MEIAKRQNGSLQFSLLEFSGVFLRKAAAVLTDSAKAE
jgi:hypothetical protein